MWSYTQKFDFLSENRCRALITHHHDLLPPSFSHVKHTNTYAHTHRHKHEQDDDKPGEPCQAIVPLQHHVAAARAATSAARLAVATAGDQAGKLLCPALLRFGRRKPSPRHVLLLFLLLLLLLLLTIVLDAIVVGSREARGGVEVVCMRPDRVRLGPPRPCTDLRLPRHHSKSAHRSF